MNYIEHWPSTVKRQPEWGACIQGWNTWFLGHWLPATGLHFYLFVTGCFPLVRQTYVWYNLFSRPVGYLSAVSFPTTATETPRDDLVRLSARPASSIFGRDIKRVDLAQRTAQEPTHPFNRPHKINIHKWYFHDLFRLSHGPRCNSYEGAGLGQVGATPGEAPLMLRPGDSGLLLRCWMLFTVSFTYCRGDSSTRWWRRPLRTLLASYMKELHFLGGGKLSCYCFFDCNEQVACFVFPSVPGRGS